MGRILVPIDPARMGYQRQTADYQSNYQSPFEGILPHVLVNTAIPLAGKLAGAGLQRYADYSGKQDLAAKQAEHEGMNPALYGRGPKPPATAPTGGEPGGERMGPAEMKRSPRAAAAGALAGPGVQDRTVMGAVTLPREDLFAEQQPNPEQEGWFGQQPQSTPGVTGYMRLQPGQGASQTPGFDDPASWGLERGPSLPIGERSGVPISEAMVDEEGNPVELAGAPGAWSKALDAIARFAAVKQGMQPYKASARGARPAAPPVGSPRRLAAEKMMQEAGAPIPTTAAPPPVRPVGHGQRVEVRAGQDWLRRAAAQGQLAPQSGGMPAPTGEMDVSRVVPLHVKIRGGSGASGRPAAPPLPTKGLNVGAGVENPGYAATQPPVATPAYQVGAGQQAQPAARGPTLRYGQKDRAWKSPEELTPPTVVDLTAPKIGLGARELAAGALGASAIGAGGVAAANMGGSAPPTAGAAPMAASPASGVQVGLPPSGPSAPPPAVVAPPPETTGAASATVPSTAAPGALPTVQNYGIPGGRRVNESAAVAALGDMTPQAVKVDVPPPGTVAKPADKTTAGSATGATSPARPPRQLLRPGVHDYQTLMNAAAIAETPEEKQQVLAAAQLSGLVDAPSESWLDVINPSARAARGFDRLRGVLGDAVGKTDPLQEIKAENYRSQIAHRRELEDQAARSDAYWAAKTQEQEAKAAEAGNQQRLKTEQMAQENRRRQEELVHLAPMLADKRLAWRARAIIAAQDAFDRGEMNQATMLFKQAAAGMNAAKMKEFLNMLPYRMRESIAKAAMFDRMPAAGTNVTFSERREAGNQDDLIKAYRAEKGKRDAFKGALDVLTKRGDRAAMDYIMRDAVTFGGLDKEIGRGELTAQALKERLQREVQAQVNKLKGLESEAGEYGGKVNERGNLVFAPTGK